MVNYVDRDFLQLFLWETFKVISLTPFEFKAAKTWIVDGVVKVKSSLIKPRGLRLQRVT